MSTAPTSATIPVPSIAEHIVITPGVCDGKPRIAGHRIKVQHIAIWHERVGMSPDEIVAEHQGLTLADVHAALAYYWDHKDQIDGDILADERFVAALQAESPPSLLQQRLASRNAANDSLPPR
jgi:uncharacterized protein (DUF433 family)